MRLWFLLPLCACTWLGKDDVAAREDPDGDGVRLSEDCAPDDPSVGAIATWYTDLDDDGYGDPSTGERRCDPQGGVTDGTDCDDADGARAPGAEEVCDGVDNDCDDAVDEDGGALRTWYIDGDGDGVGDLAVQSCSKPEGGTDEGGDCDDADPDIYPGADEVCDDGKINDCGSDIDGAWEACGLDSTADLSDAQITLYGGAKGDSAGATVASAGDMDGDGRADLAIGAPEADDGVGAAYVVQLSVSGEEQLDNVGVIYKGDDATMTGLGLGGAGDVNGDGYADLLIGAPDRDGIDGTTCGQGAAYLVYGPAESTRLGDAPSHLIGLSATSCTGFSVGSPGDMDADGHPELAIGAPAIGDSTAKGAVWLVPGASALYADLTRTALYLEGRTARLSGYSLAGPGDLSGDGLPDLAIGAPGSSLARTYIVAERPTDDLDLESDTVVLSSEVEKDKAGMAVAGAGDVDDDGYEDLLIGAPYSDENDTDAGAAYLLTGPFTESRSMQSYVAQLLGPAAQDYAGVSVGGLGDLDHDGLGEIWVGAVRSDRGGTDAGATWVLRAPLSGSVDLAEAPGVIVGSEPGDQAGRSVAAVGDQDGNGLLDLLIGAPGWDRRGGDVVDAGAAHLVVTTSY